MNTVDSMSYGTFEYQYEKGKTFTLPYRTYLPTGYDESKKSAYPILLFMHGHGEVGTENEKQIRVLQKENKLLDDLVANDTCIIVAPQCPCNPNQDFEWVNVNHVWSTGSREKLTEKPTIATQAALKLFFDEFLTKESVDLKRVYTAGISMGGYATWEIITRYPDVLAAAVPVCGSGFPSYAESIKNIAIWAFHGLSDGTVPPKGTKDMEAALKAVGGNIRANYYEGVGHNSWPNAYAEPELIGWLLSQHK